MEGRPRSINELNVTNGVRDPHQFFADGTNPELSLSEALIERYPVYSDIASLALFGDDLRICDLFQSFLLNSPGKDDEQYDIG